MNRGKSSHIPEFKGIYYNESKEQNFFEGGAHFKYKDLYLILEKLKQSYPYNITDNPSTSALTTTNKNGYTHNAHNIDKIESKTRNNQIKIEKSNTKQQLTSYTNKVNRNIFQFIQPKYIGVALHDNNTKSKNKIKNKVIIPKPNNNNNHNNKGNLHQPQSKPIYVQRNQSEDPPLSQNNQKSHPTSSRIISSTQRVIEYSDRVKQKNMNSARVNGTRNYKNNNNNGNINGSNSNNNKHINNTSNNNNYNYNNSISISNHINNGNQNTFAFSNGSSKQVKSRNCNRTTVNDFFANHSFYTKSDYRRKEKKEIISVRHTMDKEVMFNKTVNTRKVCSSITISSRGKNGYADKCSSKVGIKPKRNNQNMNGSIDMQKGKLKKSFLSS